MWVYVEQFLKGTSLTKFRNSMIIRKELIRDEAGYHWSIVKTGDVALYDFWELCKIDGLGEDGDAIPTKDS